MASRIRRAAGQNRRWKSTPNVIPARSAALDHAVGGSNIDCDGLLAQNMYTRFGSGHDYLFMYRVRRANGAGVESEGEKLLH